MKMKLKYITSVMALGVLFLACESDDSLLVEPVVNQVSDVDVPDATYTSGTANFSTYVAVGNSLTAGFSDAALFKQGQESSIPNLLAMQMALAGGGSFTQPLTNDDLGGLLLGGQLIASTRLIFDVANEVPVNVSGTPTNEITQTLSGPFNNMGVPGAKSFHLLAEGYGNVAGVATGQANPYYARFASSASASVMQDAMAQNPTFFSLWIGNNDVLSYAISGGTGVDQAGNLDPSTYGANDITDPNVFASVYNGLLATLTSDDRKGIVANIPNVTDIPFFTTVPYAPLSPANPDFGPQIPMLNMVFGALNPIFEAVDPSREIVFSETSASPVVIKDETLADISAIIEAQLNASPTFPVFIGQFGLPPEAAPLVANLLGTLYGQTRQATADDLLVLTSSSVIGTINEDFAAYLQTQGLSAELAAQFSAQGITYGLDDQWVLIPDEQEAMDAAITAFNQIIENAATTYDVPLFDVNTFFEKVAAEGYVYNSLGATLTSDFVTGGAFSLDGIHPSPRGNAVIANQMIALINAKYGSNLPELNPVDYTGLYIN
ncbi:G-D-S-L family lipolytic protein [Abyssalbus ytuae]|uniref:G-D-S-L family lipolytic protein n=1 Tax=Abyssalbus ytuae TaxID=2926907 RepID=A0A9E7CY32_9FLAO|nr:G-D-S-L family lipolytic protein [Abyssalbus ytuae]UOB16210.1 G-D-S-L family lipolytic protein [Abyssalbus ytuae]